MYGIGGYIMTRHKRKKENNLIVIHRSALPIKTTEQEYAIKTYMSAMVSKLNRFDDVEVRCYDTTDWLVHFLKREFEWCLIVSGPEPHVHKHKTKSGKIIKVNNLKYLFQKKAGIR